MCQTTIKKRMIFVILLLAPLVFIFASLFIGRYPLSIETIVKVLFFKLTGFAGLEGEDSVTSIQQTVIWDVRLPRAILAALVGGSLAVSGAAFQGLFRNPLVSSGAGFGAALAILLFNTILLLLFLLFWQCSSVIL